MKSTLFCDVYDACTAQFNGAFIPEVAAKMIAERSGLDAAAVKAALKSPKVFFYPDVLPTLDQILNRPDVLPVLWTEGQVATEYGANGYQMDKFVASGLLERYDAWDKAAEMGLPSILGGPSKGQFLPLMDMFFAMNSVAQVLVVDDNPAQLFAADGWLAQGDEPYYLLHIDRSKDVHTYPLAHIQRIYNLTGLISLLGGPGWHVILFDLDYTLIDHAKTREEMGERIAKMMNV